MLKVQGVILTIAMLCLAPLLLNSLVDRYVMEINQQATIAKPAILKNSNKIKKINNTIFQAVYDTDMMGLIEICLWSSNILNRLI